MVTSLLITSVYTHVSPPIPPVSLRERLLRPAQYSATGRPGKTLNSAMPRVCDAQRSAKEK
eukprot:997842-Amphidinium_carterae.3